MERVKGVKWRSRCSEWVILGGLDEGNMILWIRIRGNGSTEISYLQALLGGFERL
jgi:hypothetical protein